MGDTKKLAHTLRYKFGNRHFWCTGYFVSTVGENEEMIIKYLRIGRTRQNNLSIVW